MVKEDPKMSEKDFKAKMRKEDKEYTDDIYKWDLRILFERV